MNDQKKIGIWGYGIVGKAALRYFSKANDYIFQIFDKRTLTNQEIEELNIYTINSIAQNINEFVETNDYIIASPGIDISEYITKYPNKFLQEVDYFFANWTKKVIAVTGTIGKTSTVTLLDQVLQKNNIKILTGGNIGIPLFNLLERQESADVALIELSSFQLENSNSCSPDISIITNFYPNHLDRHINIDNYLSAKLHIMANQKPNQIAILPWMLRSQVQKLISNKQIIYFQERIPFKTELNTINENETIYCVKNDNIIVIKKSCDSSERNTVYYEQQILELSRLPNVSYTSNWLIVAIICNILKINLDTIKLANIKIPQHRLELIKETNKISFYNDSKSTVPESTLAAVNYIYTLNRPIHLFLGGLSKGVDRSFMFKELKDKVKTIYCFGAESDNLHNCASMYNINSQSYNILDLAVENCLKNVNAGDVVLFSPSGSSYDQFKDYQERGQYFKKLIQDLANKINLE